MEYIEAILKAWHMLLTWESLLFIAIGVVVGFVVAVLPGMGGIVGISIVLPFIWDMQAERGLPLLMGIVGVMRTADTIPAVLFAVPGTAGAQPTVIEGFPMAKKGEANRALGIAYMSSTLGAIIGSFLIVLSVPLGKMAVTSMQSPHFFMLVVLAMTMMASLAGRHLVKATVAVLLGLLLGTIGTPPGASVLRYTFGMIYLYNGIPLVVLALGLFAIPELIELLTLGTSISQSGTLGKGLLSGMKSVFKHTSLLIKSSILGAFIGFLPGLGATPAAWLAYSYAVHSAKDKEGFGKGDVRGIIAPEAANNAADAGALIPSILFGIPGSGTMAILLFALLVMNVEPGPRMLTEYLHIPFMLAFALAIGAIMGAVLCIAFARPISYLTTIPINYLAPFIMMAVLISAYQSTRHWGDLISVLVIGVIGWFMKQYGWPRPPVLIGFVLAFIAEQRLWTSVVRYGASWLIDPGVIIIGLIAIATLFFGLRGVFKLKQNEKV